MVKLKDTPEDNNLLTDHEGMDKPKVTARVDEVGILSYISFAWMFSYLWDAYKGRLDEQTSWPISIFDSASLNCTRLEHLWNEELKVNPNSPSLFKVILRFMRYRLFISCLIFLFCLVFGFIGPTCLVRGLVSFTENPPRTQGDIIYGTGLYLAVAILIVEISRVLMYGATWAISYRTGIRVRGAVLTLLYKNLLNSKTLRDKTPAEVVNVFANDGQRIFDAVTFAPLVLMGPFVIIGGVVYLIKVIGVLSLIGLSVFFIFDVIQVFLGITLVRCRNQAIQKTEQRMNLMGEILKNIRLIKMNGWEDVFLQKVSDVRKEEKHNLQKAGYAQSLAIASGTIVPVVATVVTVCAVVFAGHDLLASDIFSAITVFFVMLFGIRMIPYGARYLAEARVAITKIQSLLLFSKYEQTLAAEAQSHHAIALKEANFMFDETEKAFSTKETDKLNEEPKFCLHDINVTVNRKAKIGVCGPVGSGKSSFLQALLGCMSNEKGQVSIGGTVAYVPQTPCILNGTVRDNILFGLPLNSQRYSKVINAANLTKDLEKLPYNEKSEVGERGSKLSGGQKCRLALARALYANRDIYLLDDIFSSINKEVSQRIFEQGIKDFLGNKTVFVVTSNSQFLSECDSVIFFQNGTIHGNGTHSELLKNDQEYAEFFKNQVSVNVERESDETISEEKSNDDKEDLSKEDEEDLRMKNISKDIYLEYIEAAGGFVVFSLVLVVFVVNVGANIFGTFWLSKWMKDVHGTSQIRNRTSLADDSNLNYYATVYVASIAVLFVSGLIKAMVFVKLSINASSNLHFRMLKSVLHGVVKFFDVTPTGRILNRFSKDLDEIDVKLPFSAEALLQYVTTCAGLLLTIVWVFPLLLIAFFPLSIIFVLFFLCFRAGIRSMKRTENVTRSPVFDHVSSSLEGLSTIHSYAQHQRFIDNFKVKLDDNSSVLFMFNAAMRWQAVWLDLLVVTISFLVSCLIVFLTASVEPSDAGMALAFALQMSGIFQFAVRSQTELEAKLTAVERVSYYYKNIEQEKWIQEEEIDEQWPSSGSLEFKHVTLRYREGAAVALNKVSFKLEDKDKVLVVGRTGSGKSSIVNVVLRLYEIESGTVEYDSLDICKVPLQSLRDSITVIPQDGGLFSGSLRFNLDPKLKYSDDNIWESLERVGLKDFISSTSEKLELKIEYGGKNLSAGQRQLVCLARALLRHSKLVILDEATSNLDVKTDVLLQKIISDTFGDFTVVLISHRPENSFRMEKVLTVEDGETQLNDSSANDSNGPALPD